MKGIVLALATSVILAAGAGGAAEPPLAGCYERIYDAQHLAQHKGQLVVRMTLSIAAPSDRAITWLADGTLNAWVRGQDKSFHSYGACQADGGGLACLGSVSAAEAEICPSRQAGLTSCRIDLGDGGAFKVEGRPDGVLVSVPNRLELLQSPGIGGPYLNLLSSDAENRAFVLSKAACRKPR